MNQLDQQVAHILWTVRSMRIEGEQDLSASAVYQKQVNMWRYDQLTVEAALAEIKRRGFQWDKTYPGVPYDCIVIRHEGQQGEAQANNQ